MVSLLQCYHMLAGRGQPLVTPACQYFPQAESPANPCIPSLSPQYRLSFQGPIKHPNQLRFYLISARRTQSTFVLSFREPINCFYRTTSTFSFMAIGKPRPVVKYRRSADCVLEPVLDPTDPIISSTHLTNQSYKFGTR